jgi:hypothetical protein
MNAGIEINLDADTSKSVEDEGLNRYLGAFKAARTRHPSGTFYDPPLLAEPG